MHTNEPKEDKFQNRDIHMTISPIVSKNKQKMLYVMFKEYDKELEICIPSYEVIKNNGFSKEELDNLIVYCKVNKEQLLKRASKISIMEAFLGR